MDTNVQALKSLYVALGGDAADVADLTRSADVINALNSVAASAASELPSVKKTDAGKTLTVNSSGKWAAIMPTVDKIVLRGAWDGSDMFYISDPAYSNKKPRDICQLFMQDIELIIIAGNAGENKTFVLTPTVYNANSVDIGSDLTFSCVYRKASSTVYISLTFSYSSTSKLSNGVGPFVVKEIADPA